VSFVLPAAVSVSFEAIINCSCFRAGHPIEPRVPSLLRLNSIEIEIVKLSGSKGARERAIGQDVMRDFLSCPFATGLTG
jgi:hypothetical protein